MLDQGALEATSRTPRKTNIACLKCGAPVNVVSSAYTCDECGHVKFIDPLADKTVDTR
jgi:Zn finger protein HypA/HybF involved in hydrogenase expression